MENLLNKLIYHKFYQRYGYIDKIALYSDLNKYSEVKSTVIIKWIDNTVSIDLPNYAMLDDVEIADFKHFIKKANEPNVREKI